MSPEPNYARLTVRADLARDVLPAVVAMVAARAECPIDRLDEALLLTDAVAAHAPGRTRDGALRVDLAVNNDGLQLAVDGLDVGGAQGLLADAVLPDVGDVLERVADELLTEAGADGERLVLRLRYRSPAPLTNDHREEQR